MQSSNVAVTRDQVKQVDADLTDCNAVIFDCFGLESQHFEKNIKHTSVQQSAWAVPTVRLQIHDNKIQVDPTLYMVLQIIESSK